MKKQSSLPHFLLRAGLVCLTAAGAILTSEAQNRQASSFDEDYIFWGYPDTYLNYQARTAYPLIDQMLLAYPPAVEPDKHRKMALITLDQFLHDAGHTRREAFFTFANSRMAHMLEDFNQPVMSGVRIYKLYNSGFIIKTLKTAVAIDIVPGGNTTSKPVITDSVIYEIADRCSALLITNADSRHANRKVAKTFEYAGKKVLLPKGVWSNPGEGYMTVGADTVQTIELEEMTIHVLPGHNGNAKNNIYVIDFQGRGIVAHTGAQDNEADLKWIEQLHNKYNTDILLTQSQNLNLEAMLKGFMPRMVITGHENDMERTVDRRESYWTTQKRLNSMAELNIPNVILAWGEGYEYADTESENISKSANKVLINGILYIERKGSIYTPAGVKVK